MSRRAADTERRLRRSQRQVFPGNPSAVSPASRPLSTSGGIFLGAGGTSTSGTGRPDLLRWTATGDAIASGGDTVTFDTAVDVKGFADSTVGASFVGPFNGLMAATVTVTFASHTAGATVALRQTAGGVTTTVAEVPAAAFYSTGYAQAQLVGCVLSGATYDVHVTQSSGSPQTADVSLDVLAWRRTIPDDTPLTTVWDTGTWDNNEQGWA